MIEEHRRAYRVSLAIVLVAAVVSLPLDHTVCLGLLLGIALYYVYLRVLTSTVTAQLRAAALGSGASPLGFLARMAALAMPLAVAVRFPHMFSLVGAFVPLFVNHLVTFALYGRRGVAA